MKNKSRQHHLLLTIVVCITLILGISFTASAAIRETDVSTASSGNIIVFVPGEFAKAEVSTILNLVNSYRKEACQKGYPNPSNPSVPLKASDYTEVDWSGDLEWIAQTRAAEGAVYQAHTRPNGDWCFYIQHNGVHNRAETLAWNDGDLMEGLEQWYDEKYDWVHQTPGAVTGHYTAMINPKHKYIGIGCFSSKADAWSCVAGAYSYDSNLSSTPQGIYGSCSQAMEVPVSSLNILGPSSVVIGKTASFASLAVSFPGLTDDDMADNVTTPVLLSGTPTFTSASSAVAPITSEGLLSAKALGTTTVTISYPDGIVLTKTVTITKPLRGTAISSGGANYKITNQSGEVAYVKNISGGSSVAIPDSIYFSGFSYKVTSISNNAFKNNKVLKTIRIGNNIITIGKNAFSGCTGLKSVTIPVNVTTIGQKAFYNCKKLKKLTIQSLKLKKGTVGSKSFAKTGIKKVKVPKARKKAYKKWLYKKGIAKKAKIK